MNNSDISLSVIIVITRFAKLPYTEEQWQKTLQSVAKQKYAKIKKVFILQATQEETETHTRLNLDLDISVIPCSTYGIGWNNILASLQGEENIIWIQAERNPVFLKESACFTLALALDRDSKTGFVYSDYTLITPNGAQEKMLLEYHIGRVRDNLDLGQVVALRNSILNKIEIPTNLQYGCFYDIRLKFSHIAEIKHIGNRFAGSLYEVEKTAQAHNVFDYLQDDKKKQLEFEDILTKHLQGIGAYLAPIPTNYQIPSFMPHSSNILVSIIIPVYRRPEFIGLAIESTLDQTMRDWVEVIVVVNGGNEDPTIQVVKKYLPGGEYYKENAPKVKLLTVDVNNIGLCLNLGIMHAQGKYYMQLDSDDRLKNYAVAEVVKTFLQNPNAGMVIGSYEVWEKKHDGTLFRREDIPVVKHEEWTEENGRNNLLRINGAGAPRIYDIEVVKKLGWFSINDEDYSRNYGEDYDMVLRISEKYRIARIWSPIYEVVRHAGSTDHSIDQLAIDRNDNAKDMMRYKAILRRKEANLKK